jgi:hypothetical protein
MCNQYLKSLKKIYVYKSEKLNKSYVDETLKLEYIDENSLANASNEIKENDGIKILIPRGADVEKIKSYGLVEFDDYLCEEYIDKSIVIVYGNCHTTVISDYLEKCEAFNERYYLYRITPVCLISDKSYFNEPIFRYCDYFIHQSIQLANRYGEEFASEKIFSILKKECNIISIPNVYHLPMCFFAQYSSENVFTRLGGEGIFFRDKLLDRYAEMGLSVKKSYNSYIHDESFDDKTLDALFEIFIDKVEKREKDWDVKCKDFIIENYKTHQLFYDPNHPTNYFLLYIVSELLKMLDVQFNKEELANENIVALTGFEMPILPEVKNHFGMVFCDNDNMRAQGSKAKIGKMNTYEYVSQYLSYEWQNPKIGFLYRFYSIIRWLGMKAYNRIVIMLHPGLT